MTQAVAIVTGAAQGIGRATSLRLARDGFALAVVDINADGMNELCDDIEKMGGKALPLQCDLERTSEIQRMVTQAAGWGRLTVLVNNAGRIMTHSFLEVEETDWDATLSLDLKSVFFAMQAAARAMSPGGRIVNIASVSGRSGRADQAPYAAAKAGVISLTRSAALALAPRGILVNAVCPGIVDTPMTWQIHRDRAQRLGITAEESLARIVSTVPLRRIESPDEVAGAVSFLCSLDAAYITGQALNVCGGLEMD